MPEETITTTPPASTEPPKSDEGNKDGANAGNDGKLTQAQVDAIVKDRLAREREKYKDFDAIKSKAEQFDKLDEASKSELEKAQGEANKWKSEAESAIARAETLARRAAVIAEASKQQALVPDDVFALIDRSALKIDNDGNVEGVADAVKAVLDARPHFKMTRQQQFGSADGGTQSGGGPSGTFTRSQIADPTFFAANRAAILEAQKTGSILDE